MIVSANPNCGDHVHQETPTYQESFDCIPAGLRPSVTDREDLISVVSLLRWQPGQGRVLVAVLHAYLDESKAHCDDVLMCSAGYVFTNANARKFSDQWDYYLRQNAMSGFHATEEWKLPRADEKFRKLRTITQATASKGFIRFALSSQINILTKNPDIRLRTGDAYAALTLSCMEKIAEYAKGQGDEVWYFIESRGEKDPSEIEFRKFLDQIRNNLDLKKRFAYYESSMIRKEHGIQLQSADLAAWSLSRAWREFHIPGFESDKDWWAYYKDHSVSGFSDQSITLQAMGNAINGFQKLVI